MALPNHDNIIHYGPEEDIEANIFTHNDGFRNRSPDTVHFNPERNVYYSQTCVVCLENPPVEVVWPCRHACLCRPCAGRLKILSSRCPEHPESEAERRSWEEFQEDMAVLDSLDRIMDDPGKSEEQKAEARRKYEDYVRKTTEHSLVVCSDGTTFGGGHHPRGMVFDNRVRSRVEETFSVEELRQNNVYGDPRRGYGVMESNRIQAITEHLVAIEGTPTSAEDQAFKPRRSPASGPSCWNRWGEGQPRQRSAVLFVRRKRMHMREHTCCTQAMLMIYRGKTDYGYIMSGSPSDMLMIRRSDVRTDANVASMANLEEEMDHVWDYFATTVTQLVTQIHCPGATPAAESSKATVIESVETAKNEPQTGTTINMSIKIVTIKIQRQPTKMVAINLEKLFALTGDRRFHRNELKRTISTMTRAMNVLSQKSSHPFRKRDGKGVIGKACLTERRNSGQGRDQNQARTELVPRFRSRFLRICLHEEGDRDHAIVNLRVPVVFQNALRSYFDGNIRQVIYRAFPPCSSKTTKLKVNFNPCDLRHWHDATLESWIISWPGVRENRDIKRQRDKGWREARGQNHRFWHSLLDHLAHPTGHPAREPVSGHIAPEVAAGGPVKAYVTYWDCVVRPKGRKEHVTHWDCVVRPKGRRCPASVIERTGQFKMGNNQHNHPPVVNAATDVKIQAAVRQKAADNVYQSASAIVRDVVMNQVRMANRGRQKQRLADPTSLDFQLDEDHLPDNLLCADVRVHGKRHLVFASSHQLQLLAKTKTWYVDGTFKVVRKLFKQLFSIHAFTRKEGVTKQVPLAFVLMSEKREEDYRKLVRPCFDRVDIPCLRSDLEKCIVEIDDPQNIFECTEVVWEVSTWVTPSCTNTETKGRRRRRVIGSHFRVGQWIKKKYEAREEIVPDGRTGMVYHSKQYLMAKGWLESYAKRFGDAMQREFPVGHPGRGVTIRSSTGARLRGMVFDNRVRALVFSVEELRQNNVYGDPRRGNANKPGGPDLQDEGQQLYQQESEDHPLPQEA
ncbi:hypothetical protein Bbelb_051880 [Branchiostoma belcheri]|nr:hypothetical protein Bbelb_051880 [Branchiostoma belcheri]